MPKKKEINATVEINGEIIIVYLTTTKSTPQKILPRLIISAFRKYGKPLKLFPNDEINITIKINKVKGLEETSKI